MSRSDRAAHDHRVLVLAPTSKDASLTEALLSAASIDNQVCSTIEILVRELTIGAGAILVPEEVVSSPHSATLSAVLSGQPPWSDIPVLVLTRHGADSADSNEAVRTLGNVTLLERPVRVTSFMSAVRTALRARERQYQIRGYLLERARIEESLRIADQRKDEFLATLGHELRNPLAPLLTGLQLLKMSSPQSPATLRVADVMERQTLHLVRLVDDLLEMSRITRGVIDVHQEPLDLAAIMQAAIETSRPTIEASKHALSVTLPAEPITVKGDTVRLTQVFGNLLTNAAKYTNAGGQIWFTAHQAGDRAVVTVRDNGIGIPTTQLGSVFDMFVQVDRSNRRTQGGLGIGLTLVRSLVEMHGGTVEAHSAGVGRGSEFVVELPVLAEPSPIAGRSVAPRKLPPRRILIVDDNSDAGDTLAALLAALGATVTVVSSGDAALLTLDSFNPEVVLLDIGMPGMDGYEVARTIRATPRHRHVLLIALTGWGQEQDQQRSRAAGFDHHLVKPPSIDKLRELLTSMRHQSIEPT